MSWIDDMKRDREAGTPGPWQCSQGHAENYWDHYVYGPETGCDGDYRLYQDACRIARVPDMEAALLASEELAAAVQQYLALPADRMTNRLERALAAFRLATGGSA